MIRSKPRLAITMGDPAGIGPEVVVRACAYADVRSSARIVLVGDAAVFGDVAARLGLRDAAAAADVVEAGSLRAADRRPGKPSAAGAEAAYQAILAAVELVRRGDAEAVVTAPVSKRAIQRAGHRAFVGHTELIAELAGKAEVRMMMAGPTLRVVLATTHIALAQVPRAIGPELVARTIEIAADGLRRHFAIRRPRIAVSGLNPHAGEGGAFGDEERRILEPAMEAARKRGAEASGPFPGDTVFHRARAGEFDAVVALYHDQGLIPFKLLHFEDGVNVTLGLPFVRTSPDHGTAFDIAGRGVADPSSMLAAIRLAARMAGGRRRARAA